ncbi:uncharacterized protein B0I36DRAFT_43122 [Microdochium trichocladiopsis]|uniref:Uncharacterized protein n=1 Tax=Microdochium trichocladiopsis TaxID=1682393 RepID=A0A9P9BM72_9PEZI|nr:uncharacterized protein B0I36DRAFT_43122 [Microdochium trichocladiopsis]KAH7016135.1 hypothetical protein B0I36DRAFT_43122 [Microdochium trichocladiopsis]
MISRLRGFVVFYGVTSALFSAEMGRVRSGFGGQEVCVWPQALPVWCRPGTDLVTIWWRLEQTEPRDRRGPQMSVNEKWSMWIGNTASSRPLRLPNAPETPEKMRHVIKRGNPQIS